MTAPILNGFLASITFDDNTVNATPQLLDVDVTLVDPDNDWDGGTLFLTGILAEDTVSVQNVGTGAGQVGLSGANVTFAGLTIGALAGGTGSNLTITFNASATTAMVEAVIENLTYANSSNTPTASRDFRINITDASGDDLGGGASNGFTNGGALTGAANPFDRIDVGFYSKPSFVDLDGDGDLDLVSGALQGTLLAFENNGSGYTELIGAANPFNGIDVGYRSAPSFVDLDGDGDLDLVSGDIYGSLLAFENTGSGYTALTGAANPFNGIGVGSGSAPSFVDLDGDGDLDLVSGEVYGTLRTFENTGSGYTELTGTANPFDGIDVGSFSAPSFVDLDGDGDLDLVIGERNGTLRAFENTGSGYTELTGTANPFNGINSGLYSAPSFVDLDGDGDLDLVSGSFGGRLLVWENTAGLGPAGQTITVNITPENDAPTLTDFAPSVTFLENTVNATPQLLDADVTVVDPEGNFNGGTLTLSGILAEDTVSVQNVGNGAGEIGFDGTNVSFGGLTIGSLAGGTGSNLTITFNASATTAMVEAVIENLTYANTSGVPTASRDFALNITDASGEDLGFAGRGFTNGGQLTGTDNPFNNFSAHSFSTPTFIDFDGDGDLDLVSGERYGTLLAFENTGGSGYAQLTGASNPFNGIDVGNFSAPAFFDLEGDGDLDLVIGEQFGELFWFENTGNGYSALTGSDEPLMGSSIAPATSPTAVDLDGDGDLDLLVGDFLGRHWALENTGNGLFISEGTVLGLEVGAYSKPVFVDFDGDGDLDLVSGEQSGTLVAFENTGNGYTRLTGTDNPFNGIDVGLLNAPSFVDVDGDGDLDLVSGDAVGRFNVFQNTDGVFGAGRIITVNVTAENDAPEITTSAALSAVENLAAVLDINASDPEGDTEGSGLTYAITGGADAAFFTINQISGRLRFLATPDFESPGDAGGDNVYDVQVTVTDSSGLMDVQDIAVTVTNADEAPTLTGFATSVAFLENTVNATPQLLDADVTIADPEGDFNNATLTITGILAEDTVSVSNVGTGAGEIGFDGTAVTFEGVTIGTLAGGAGADLTITLNASATAAGIESLIESLTYANSSDTPTSSRDLRLNVTDASGADLGGGSNGFTNGGQLTGTDNPFDGIDVGYWSAPSFVDLDGDGDLDLVSGENYGTLRAFENTGSGYTELIATANPFNGIDVGLSSTPSFVDLDGDGDLDLVSGERNGTLRAFENTGSGYTELTGTANPFNGIDVGSFSAPSFVDLDGDGDLDLVSGESSGTLRAFENTGSGYTELTATANPFNGIDVGFDSTPSFVDLDGDGDLDLVSGDIYGSLLAFENTGSGYTALTGAANPFNGIGVGSGSAPSFVDLDGDGDLDLVSGSFFGRLLVWENSAGAPPSGESITVNVTAENDAPTISGDQAIAVDEGGSVVLTVADFVGADVDDATSDLTYTVSAQSNGSVRVAGAAVTSFTQAQLLAGQVTFLHDASETTTGGFSVTVADDDGAMSNALVVTAAVTLLNDAPVIAGDLSATVNEGETYTLTLADLSAVDGDHTAAQLSFVASALVNGVLLVNGAIATSFTLEDIQNGLVAFRHDGATSNDGSFSINVRDGNNVVSANATFTVTAEGPLTTDGGNGAETIRGSEVNNLIRGLGGNDRIDGFGGNDTLFGNAGNDTLVGGGGDDILNGGEGDDRLFGGEGADTLIGRGGTDLASYKTAAAAIVLDLSNIANNTGDAAGDTYDSIERYEGSRFADTMTGTLGADYLLGGDGNDVINGSGGNDLLFGEAGDDTLNGGADQDILRAGDGDDTLNGDAGNDVLRGEDGLDTLNGGIGNDTLYGGDGDDILNGGDGNDVFVGGAGGDQFTGGDGNDRVTYSDAVSGVTIDLTNAANSTGIALGDTFSSIETIQGSDFDDIFVGTDLRDRLFGLDGADQMMAGAGNDLLEGGNGNDVLDGAADADILRGGADNDTLTGGTGKDRFQFGANGGADTITDFSQSELDRMQFTDASGVESMADLTIVQQGNDTLITYAQGSILLEDFTATDLAAADFSFL